MARRRRLTRMVSRADKPGGDPDRDEELDGLAVELMEPTSAREEEEEELDLISVRRKVAESVGAPVHTCATIFLYGAEELFERTSPDHPLVLGRHHACDIQLQGNSVSRRHAELTYSDDVWFVRDLDSKSGSKVNGETATGLMRLRDGDELRLGDVVLKVSFSAMSESKRKIETTGPRSNDQDASAKGLPHAVEESPIWGSVSPQSDTRAKTPALHIAESDHDNDTEDQAETKKRHMDHQDLREVEKIKTFGIIGVAIVVLVAIIAGLAGGSGVAPSSSGKDRPGTKYPPANGTAETGRPKAPQTEPEAPTVSTKEEPRAGAAEGKPGNSVVAIENRLPAPPEALPADLSPFEPRWFTGPGKGTALTAGGETIRGSFRIEGPLLHVDVAGIATKTKLAEVKNLIWDGARDFKEADTVLQAGNYVLAAERYAIAIREIETSARSDGKDPAEYPGRWYVEGRRNECLSKAAHLNYCQTVFGQAASATTEQLNAAGSSFTRLATPGVTPNELCEKFEALLAAGKISLSEADRARWQDRKRQRTTAESPTKP